MPSDLEAAGFDGFLTQSFDGTTNVSHPTSPIRYETPHVCVQSIISVTHKSLRAPTVSQTTKNSPNNNDTCDTRCDNRTVLAVSNKQPELLRDITFVSQPQIPEPSNTDE